MSKSKSQDVDRFGDPGAGYLPVDQDEEAQRDYAENLHPEDDVVGKYIRIDGVGTGKVMAFKPNTVLGFKVAGPSKHIVEVNKQVRELLLRRHGNGGRRFRVLEKKPNGEPQTKSLSERLMERDARRDARHLQLVQGRRAGVAGAAVDAEVAAAAAARRQGQSVLGPGEGQTGALSTLEERLAKLRKGGAKRRRKNSTRKRRRGPVRRRTARKKTRQRKPKRTLSKRKKNRGTRRRNR